MRVLHSSRQSLCRYRCERGCYTHQGGHCAGTGVIAGATPIKVVMVQVQVRAQVLHLSTWSSCRYMRRVLHSSRWSWCGYRCDCGCYTRQDGRRYRCKRRCCTRQRGHHAGTRAGCYTRQGGHGASTGANAVLHPSRWLSCRYMCCVLHLSRWSQCRYRCKHGCYTCQHGHCAGSTGATAPVNVDIVRYRCESGYTRHGGPVLLLSISCSSCQLEHAAATSRAWLHH